MARLAQRIDGRCSLIHLNAGVMEDGPSAVDGCLMNQERVVKFQVHSSRGAGWIARKLTGECRQAVEEEVSGIQLHRQSGDEGADSAGIVARFKERVRKMTRRTRTIGMERILFISGDGGSDGTWSRRCARGQGLVDELQEPISMLPVPAPSGAEYPDDGSRTAPGSR